jgi:hypothetical protein
MITMRALCITAEKCRGMIFCQNNSGYSALGWQILIAQHRTNHQFGFHREIPNRSNLWNISERHIYIYMKCLSIFKGHEHVLGSR